MTPFSLIRIAVVVLFAAVCVACGSNQEERGIETQPEVAVPVDPAELRETEKQRQAELVEDLQ